MERSLEDTAIRVLRLARTPARGLVVYNRRLHPADTGAEQPATVHASRKNAAVELRQDTRRAGACRNAGRRRRRAISRTRGTFIRGKRASMDARCRRLRG